MKLPHAEWQRRPAMARLLDSLAAGRGETRYVGGCVRDTLRDADVSDVDLATRFKPDEVMGRLREAKIKAVPTGLAHGTVTAVIEGKPVEITTLRRDVSTDGRRATVAYTDDWKEDAARRDFTINALSADPQTAEVHDYFGGCEDLAAGRVRFIGAPLQRIAEDHLRILRFFRFHARFGRDAPGAEALEACADRANDLMALSRERIADELLKLLALPEPAATVQLMISRGILRPVIPEIDEAGGDRLAELVEREKVAGVEGEALRRFSALLPPSPETATSVGRRLRLSNKALKRLANAVLPVDAPPETLAYEIGREGAVDRILIARGDPYEARRLDGWQRPRLYVGGGSLIEMGLQPGPVVARCLHDVQRRWATAGFPADKETQMGIARAAVERLLGDSR
jgi:poly(A) polymerase